MTALMEWKKFSDDLGYVGTPHDPGPSLARRKLRMTAGPPVKASTAWPNFHGLFGAASRAFFIFIFFENIFYRNIFSISHFTVLYPYRPAGGRQGACRPPGGRQAPQFCIKGFPSPSPLICFPRHPESGRERGGVRERVVTAKSCWILDPNRR